MSFGRKVLDTTDTIDYSSEHYRMQKNGPKIRRTYDEKILDIRLVRIGDHE